jgi:hypothetical protein
MRFHCITDATGQKRYKATPEYSSWKSMRDRCLSGKHKAYERYAGRGITICDEWVNDFERFAADMGPRPVGCTLERLDNSKGYEPGNCAWRTRKEQQNNTRSNRYLTRGEVTKTMKQWCEELGLNYGKLRARAQKNKSLDLNTLIDELLTSVGPRPTLEHLLDGRSGTHGYESGKVAWLLPGDRRSSMKKIMVTHEGVTRGLKEWTDVLGLNYYTAWDRIKQQKIDPLVALGLVPARNEGNR